MKIKFFCVGKSVTVVDQKSSNATATVSLLPVTDGSSEVKSGAITLSGNVDLFLQIKAGSTYNINFSEVKNDVTNNS